MRRAPLVFFALVAGCGSGDPAAPAGGGPGGASAFRFPVTFIEAAAGTVEEMVALVGDVETTRRAALAFERAGRVAEVSADNGDHVTAGMPLARLDDAVLEAELRAARASVVADRADADFALSELKRARELGSTIAQSERDRWTSESAAREARAARSAAEVGRLETQLAQGVLRAPFDGTVVERRVTLGSHAAAGAPAFELVDLESLEVRLELPASIAAHAQAGDRVLLATDDGEVELRLASIIPSADPGTRTFRAIARFDRATAPGLRPGAFVRSRLTLRAAEGIVVPADALLDRPQGSMLVVADGGDGAAPPVARLVPVKILARGADGVAVAPLQPGDLVAGARVVVTGSDNVFPGAPLLLQPHKANL